MSSSTTKNPNLNAQFSSSNFFSDFLNKRSFEPGWLVDLRKDAWNKFQNMPAVKSKDERWRFSPRSRLGYAKFGSVCESNDNILLNSGFEEDIFFETLENTILNNPDLIKDLQTLTGPNLGSEETFNLCRSFSESGFTIKTKQGTKIKKTLTCHHISPGNNESLFQTNIISVEPFSELTIIEYFDSKDQESPGMLSNLNHIILREGAKLNRIIIQRLNDHSTFKHLEKIELHKDAQFTSVSLHLGGEQSRVESNGIIKGSGADFNNFSLSLGRDEQLFDQRTIQHHVAPNGRSNLLFKNALLDESKSVFSGLIKVDPAAQNTDSFQTNRNLLLSNDAEADSLPGLEILANEVKCSHGATTSKIDEQELFYLQSRGMSKKLSEKLIVLGFFEEIIGQVKSDSIIQELRNEVSEFFNS
jgi:Fe-S cluster assembly protein SufD